MNTIQTNNTIRAYLASLGRIGGRKGSRADKVRAGKLGAQARYGKKQPTKATP